MRAHVARLLVVSAVVALLSSSLAAAPRKVREGDPPRDELPIVKFIKKLKANVRSLGDSLTIPKP